MSNYYKKHKRRIREMQLLYYYLHRDQILQMHRERNQSLIQKEKRKEYHKKYYLENRVRILLQGKLKTYQKNKARIKKEKVEKVEKVQKEKKEEKKKLLDFNFNNYEENFKLRFD